MRRSFWIIPIAMLASSPAQAASPAPAAARVGNQLTRAGAPTLQVAVPKGAAYAGARRFVLRGVADAEIHVFVEAGDDRKVRKIYWVQFEEYLPDNTHEYSYADGNTRRRIGGMDFWVSARHMAADGASPGSDRAAAVELIKAAGYTLPEHIMRARLLHLPDDSAGTGRGRRELMVIYAEDVALSGVTAAGLAPEGAASARWPQIGEALIERALASIAVESR